MPLHPRLTPLAALLTFTLAAAGCASSGAAGEPMHATTNPAGGRVTIVPVELDDYVIRMPAKLPAGDVRFDVKNVGHHAHRLKVDGPVDADMDHNLAPGDAGELPLHLTPGTYKFTCPVGPHAMLGMKRNVTVKQ